jgi:hypothetical protein
MQERGEDILVCYGVGRGARYYLRVPQHVDRVHETGFTFHLPIVPCYLPTKLVSVVLLRILAGNLAREVAHQLGITLGSLREFWTTFFCTCKWELFSEFDSQNVQLVWFNIRRINNVIVIIICRNTI